MVKEDFGATETRSRKRISPPATERVKTWWKAKPEYNCEKAWDKLHPLPPLSLSAQSK
jgi:hypothetical protein